MRSTKLVSRGSVPEHSTRSSGQSAMDPWIPCPVLRDTVAIVAGGDTPMGAELAAGLVDVGATAVVTTSRFASAAVAQQAFGPVAPFGLLVHVPFDAVALEREPLAATGEHEWE